MLPTRNRQFERSHYFPSSRYLPMTSLLNSTILHIFVPADFVLETLFVLFRRIKISYEFQRKKKTRKKINWARDFFLVERSQIPHEFLIIYEKKINVDDVDLIICLWEPRFFVEFTIDVLFFKRILIRGQFFIRQYDIRPKYVQHRTKTKDFKIL